MTYNAVDYFLFTVYKEYVFLRDNPLEDHEVLFNLTNLGKCEISRQRNDAEFYYMQTKNVIS